MVYELTFVGIVGVITFILTVLTKILGHPDQVKKNYLRKSTEGISTRLYVLAFLSYSFWTLHGILQKDLVVIAGQSLGVVTTGIILFQVFLYRKKE